ncbi:heme ABC transporter ATP-binding protein [Arenibacterium halophilum]|uniref:Heme ABC transporter ATP-binding protein n=1 Tax=Arenibacterium halophilum TaxID=2583821 RepID=A0ABY2X9K4_9RHOB|nr:heme ABC transporter ATP-binding protein [Arenibacterium halophilum]TMV13031.1 heme ABC transporter ATP-binding protein [Arenibacterium halophilum]
MSYTAANILVEINRRVILTGAALTARPGQVTAIVGPNGSGKSTLLKAIIGEIPSRGEITLNGCDARALSLGDLAATRGVLPQASALAFPFTVIEVVRMGLAAGRHAARPQIADQALAAVDLSHHAQRYFQDLSGGEQQRAQLARVLAQVWEPVEADTPRWLLLDEPVSSLDLGHQLQVMELARAYARRGGGVIAVMHDLNLTAIYADHVALIHNGQTVAQGTVADVLTDDRLSTAFDCPVHVNIAPESGATFLLPHASAL